MSLRGFAQSVLCACLFYCGTQVARITSAAETVPPTQVTTAPKFDVDVRPVFQAKCWQCHGPDAQKGELSLQTAASIRKGGESGSILVPGKSAESRLYEVIHHGEMPPEGQEKLSAAEVETIRRWIDSGASFGAETNADVQVTQHDVLPIMLLRCTVCHGRHKKEGDLDLRNREGMLRGGKSGPAFVPGKPAESLMLKRIRAEEMPPHQRLTEVSVKPMDPEETKTLTRWIEAGAPVAPQEPELAGTADDPLVRPKDREFWSFRAVQSVAIPVVQDASRLRSPLDVFIAQKLNEKGLELSETADPSVLLRRISFDLIGLPPNPDDAKQFAHDPAPDALERMVDRLLASPRYGERWGRHWLDVAGYSECEGRREQHLPRPAAWRYRDYVIRSLNADKPYDRFLMEQLAGDELANYEQAPRITQELEDNLVATGFLRMAPDPTWANLTGFVPDRLEVMADSIDVLGSGVMGLTFKCARCHTHKFDPIPQRDYYRLVDLFKGAYDEHDWLKPQLQSFGGAMSVGLGERLLPYVTSDERRRWEQSPPVNKSPEPRVMALWDRGDPSPTYVYRRGNHATPGSLVTPGVPAVLSDPAKPFHIEPPWPEAKSTGRRLALAKWLTDPAQPLTSRVIVNRIWKHHFGQGIVRSVGNFGKTGDRPTHPELLDYLAGNFMRQGWRMKTLHRQLILSAAYQQSSIVSAAAQQLDPADFLLSRMPLQRVDAEELRDTILLAAEELNEAGGGPSEPVQVRGDGLVLTGRRRSIYVEQLRKHPPSLLESFDLPAMNPNCLQRSDSLVATQALHLWNDAAIRQLASRFADRVLQIRQQRPDPSLNDDQQSATEVYWIALGRPPSKDELLTCVQAMEQLRTGWQKQSVRPANDTAAVQDANRKALATFCHTILNSADFLYID